MPSGIHGFIDMMAFSTFMLVVGKFGFEAQFATNVAMNVNLLLFIPAFGLTQACTILAGQFAGAKKPHLTEQMTSGVLILCGIHLVISCFLYIETPHLFINWFRGNIPSAEWANLVALAKMLLIVVAIYSIFDAINLAFSGTLKGAGDTHFVMLLSLVFSHLLLVGPCAILVLLRHRLSQTQGLMLAWIFCSLYIFFLALAFTLRYRAGKWKTMQVIEEEPIEIDEGPNGDFAPSAENALPAG